MSERIFTLEELRSFDGREGRRALIAYRGRIYDLSSSFLWQEGKHFVVHRAGSDLSAALDEAPHGADLLERFPVVGRLVAE